MIFNQRYGRARKLRMPTGAGRRGGIPRVRKFRASMPGIKMYSKKYIFGTPIKPSKFGYPHI